ncbi:MAG: DUF882 domain-containing protein [Gammaproteobacteria bacterium]|nr:MAG: DUF882 domain-containing protein [Gammaproteobacteria bacterium]
MTGGTPASNQRRRLLRGLLAAAGLGCGMRVSADVVEVRRIGLLSTHTGEELELDYFSGGAYQPEALAAFDQLLRDHRTGEVAPIDPRLFDLLHKLAAGAGCAARFAVISGYRSPLTNAMLNARSSGVASRSLHMQGLAIDVRLPGCPSDRLRDLALGRQVGGVGYYRASDFVHLDVGRIRSWSG